MRAFIPYPLVVAPHPNNDTNLTADEALRIRSRIKAAISDAAVSDNRFAVLREQRQNEPCGWKNPGSHRWLPPISPLELMALNPHECWINGPIGRIVMISVRCSYGGVVL